MKKKWKMEAFSGGEREAKARAGIIGREVEGDCTVTVMCKKEKVQYHSLRDTCPLGVANE